VLNTAIFSVDLNEHDIILFSDPNSGNPEVQLRRKVEPHHSSTEQINTYLVLTRKIHRMNPGVICLDLGFS
jgi:hypothetical protein